VKHNVYFGGTVQSLGFDHAAGTATVGVMEAGEYEFSTGLKERVDVVSGVIEVKLPGQDWVAFAAGTSFNAPADSKFQVRMKAQVAYVCWFG
jgi:purine/pyrimidine-nucleoside phosphorylase